MEKNEESIEKGRKRLREKKWGKRSEEKRKKINIENLLGKKIGERKIRSRDKKEEISSEEKILWKIRKLKSEIERLVEKNKRRNELGIKVLCSVKIENEMEKREIKKGEREFKKSKERKGKIGREIEINV